MIATLGNFEFEVSSSKIKTFSDLKLSHSASYSEHKVIARKGVLEFTGLSASTASLSVKLSEHFGVHPMQEISALRELMDNHELLAFSLGGNVIGEGLWVIEGIEENDTVIDAWGNIIEANISLKLKESVNYA